MGKAVTKMFTNAEECAEMYSDLILKAAEMAEEVSGRVYRTKSTKGDIFLCKDTFMGMEYSDKAGVRVVIKEATHHTHYGWTQVSTFKYELEQYIEMSERFVKYRDYVPEDSEEARIFDRK